MQRRYVVDTSLFTNPEGQRAFGADSDQALTGFVELIEQQGLEVYLPLSVFRELGDFLGEDPLTVLRRHTTVREPDLHNIQVPAAMFHAFIQDLRNRVNKGLAIAEKAIHREAAPENVRWVREQYRAAVRGGMVDSAEDFDVVVLAREVGAAVVSEDRGIANMAAELGLEVFSGREFARVNATAAGSG